MFTIKNLMQEQLEKLSFLPILLAKRSVEEIFAKVLKVSRTKLFLEPNTEISLKQKEEIESLIKRCVKREPLDYILEKKEFYGCEISLTKDVLIPRVETELLVDLIVEELKGENSLEGRVLFDIATGSGCIAIALKKRFPSLRVIGSDICEKALRVAKENAKNNHVDIEFVQGDLFLPFRNKRADYIVSNPPYISEEEFLGLDVGVKEFEPKKALIGGKWGWEFYRRFREDMEDYTNKGCKIFFEIGHAQGEKIQKIFHNQGKIIQDLAKKQRFFFLGVK